MMIIIMTNVIMINMMNKLMINIIMRMQHNNQYEAPVSKGSDNEHDNDSANANANRNDNSNDTNNGSNHDSTTNNQNNNRNMMIMIMTINITVILTRRWPPPCNDVLAEKKRETNTCLILILFDISFLKQRFNSEAAAAVCKAGGPAAVLEGMKVAAHILTLYLSLSLYIYIYICIIYNTIHL